MSAEAENIPPTGQEVASVEAAKALINLTNFAEHDPKERISSPRSLTACAQEGVAPSDLIYKPIEAFVEKGLEPRLVKLVRSVAN